MKSNQAEDVRVLNDGLHSKRRLNTIQQVFKTHDLKNAVLYHIILSGSQDKAVYQATMKALMRHIRTKCRAEYMNAYEVGEEKGGLHCHMFVIIETAKHFPSDLLDVREGQWIARRIKHKTKGHSIRIEPPKNAMHGGAMFARMNTPAKLENCINWATYQLKPRSKDGVPGRETYSGSEFVSNIEKREAQRQKHRDALTKSSPLPAASKAAEEVVTQTTETKGDELTPAARYVATRYEEAVDAGLDVEAVRLYLLSKGIPRTPAQVRYELDEVYGFHQYADQHPAAVRHTYGEIDAHLGREKPSKVDGPSRTNRLSRVCLSDPSKLSHKDSSIGLTVFEPSSIIEPPTQLSQARSQA